VRASNHVDNRPSCHNQRHTKAANASHVVAVSNCQSEMRRIGASLLPAKVIDGCTTAKHWKWFLLVIHGVCQHMGEDLALDRAARVAILVQLMLSVNTSMGCPATHKGGPERTGHGWDRRVLETCEVLCIDATQCSWHNARADSAFEHHVAIEFSLLVSGETVDVGDALWLHEGS